MITNEINKLPLSTRCQQFANPLPVAYDRSVCRNKNNRIFTRNHLTPKTSSIDCDSEQHRGLGMAAAAQCVEKPEQSSGNDQLRAIEPASRDASSAFRFRAWYRAVIEFDRKLALIHARFGGECMPPPCKIREA